MTPPNQVNKPIRVNRRTLSDRVRKVDEHLDLCDRRLNTFFDSFVHAVQQEFSVKCVSAWHHDPVNRRLLHASTAGVHTPFPATLDVRTSLMGKTIESKQPRCQIDVSGEYGKHQDQHATQTGVFGLKFMDSTPVLNSANRNQVLCVINLLNDKPTTFDSRELKDLARVCTEHYEDLLHEACYTRANLVQQEFARIANVSAEGLYGALAARVREAIACDLVVVWQKGIQGDLRFGGITPHALELLRNSMDDIFLEARKCVDTNREQMHFVQQRATDLSGFEDIATCAIPIRNLRGEAIGAMVCLKACKQNTARHIGFNYGDIAICESLGQSLAVFSQLLAGESERLESLSRLGHELGKPVVGMKAVLELVREEIGNYRFTHDFLSDLDSYTKTFADLLQDFETGSMLQLQMTLNLQLSDWVVDVVAPAMRAIKEDVANHGLPLGRMTRPNLHIAPRTMLDRGRMQRVILNLLQNAVKYADDDGSLFQVTVSYAREGDFAAIIVRDQGIGVPEGSEERIFSFGYRAMNAIAKQPTGLGFGLPIARKIVQAHGGQLQFRRPTSGQGSEFVVKIPIAVAR